MNAYYPKLCVGELTSELRQSGLCSENTMRRTLCLCRVRLKSLGPHVRSCCSSAKSRAECQKKLIFSVNYYRKCFNFVLLLSAVLLAIWKGSRRKRKIFPEDVQCSIEYDSNVRRKTPKVWFCCCDFLHSGFKVCGKSDVTDCPFAVHHLNKWKFL